jgi:uncharacterized protein YprB with RNaseH-like and TPR domain
MRPEPDAAERSAAPRRRPATGCVVVSERRIDLKRELEELKKRAEGVFTARRSAIPPRPRTAAVRLADAAAGEETAGARGVFYRIRADAPAIWPDAPAFHREYLEALAGAFFPPAPPFAPLRALRDVPPERAFYLDIETTGLGGAAPLFLVGLMYSSGASLVVDQLFARDYSEEAAVLSYLAGLSRRFDALVTFNGISFDVPYIRDRATVHRIAFAPPAVHVDLLHVARGVVAGRTPNHRLQTLELHLCKRKRIGDIPGAEIPGAYHEFVRTGDAKDVANILHHNRLDLVTMLQLVTIFLSSRS